jgi:FkbM family methyltransferase
MRALANIAGFISSHPLTRDQKLRAFGRVVRWQVASRLQSENIVPWIAGTRLAVRRGMAGATGNIYCGLHEFEDMAFLLHFLRPDDVFADVGANIGSYGILASGVCKARAFAFEPDPVTFAALLRNIALNRLDGLIRCRECALGSRQGHVGFTVGLDTVNRVATAEDSTTRTVSIDTLDHALAGECPSLIKLDVEGFESEVLGGAAQTLVRPELKAIITEDRSTPVLDSLRAAGFVEHSYDPFSRRLQPEPSAGQRHNALFVRDAGFVQERVADAAPVQVLNKWL